MKNSEVRNCRLNYYHYLFYMKLVSPFEERLFLLKRNGINVTLHSYESWHNNLHETLTIWNAHHLVICHDLQEEAVIIATGSVPWKYYHFHHCNWKTFFFYPKVQLVLISYLCKSCHFLYTQVYTNRCMSPRCFDKLHWRHRYGC